MFPSSKISINSQLTFPIEFCLILLFRFSYVTFFSLTFADLTICFTCSAILISCFITCAFCPFSLYLCFADQHYGCVGGAMISVSEFNLCCPNNHHWILITKFVSISTTVHLMGITPQKTPPPKKTSVKMPLTRYDIQIHLNSRFGGDFPFLS